MIFKTYYDDEKTKVFSMVIITDYITTRGTWHFIASSYFDLDSNEHGESRHEGHLDGELMFLKFETYNHGQLLSIKLVVDKH